MSGAAALWCRSNYSFLEGASHPEELVEEAARLGLAAIGLADRDGVYGVVRAHAAAREAGIPLVVGATVTVDDARAAALDAGEEAGPSPEASELVLLAQDRDGYGRLCTLLSKGRRRSPKGTSAARWEEVMEAAPGLVALWGGGRSSLVVAPEMPAHAAGLREAFGDALYAMLPRHHRVDEAAAERRTRSRARALGIETVAATEVLYHQRARRELQDVLTCVRHGVTLSTAGRRLRPNAEHDLKAPRRIASLFEDDPASVRRTLEVAERCAFSLGAVRYRYPSERVPGGMTSGAWLRRLTFDGAFERYGGPPPADVEAQLERELAVIDALDYGGYFLTMWEIVRYCREHGILCQGRGSAANSAVCFCLGITAVDPVRMGLLFERFLSRERAEPPDIDLDIAHERREEVIQHVYEKYGREHAAMVANVIRYRPKSAVRDVGKVLDIPATALDRLAKLLSHHAAPTEDVLASAGLEMDAPVNGHLLRLATELLDFPRHLSIHPGGFLLGHEPVHTLVPIENATMPGRTVIQWDKDDIDALGLFKVDLLGLGALTHLDKCFDLLEAHRGMRLDLASIPADDEDTYDMICDADTVGVFQIESRAQMAMLPRLRPRTFHDLVVEVSIVRPGPISGDMVHPYLRRREGLEEVVYPHPILIPVLERTLGVPLFQEQVMKLAVVAADYTPGEADQLRRDMAAWRSRGRIEQHHERLVARMVEKGIAAEFAERVFEQIRGFGEYGFPESHAASFALLSYATSYLRCHFLPEFVCALLNAQPMGFYSSATIIEDARRHGLEVRPMDVGCSRWDCTLEPAPQPTPGHQPFALRLGARTLKGMRRDDWEAVEAARPFEGVDALVAQTGLSRRALRLLAESGALESIAPGRREALWSVLGAIPEREASLAVRDKGSSGPLFESLDLMDTISWDYRTSALSALGHPLGAIREALTEAGLPDARAVSELPDGRRIHYAGLAICRQRPTTAGGAVFMTLEDESGFVNLVIWEQVFEQHSLLIRTASFMGVTGRVQAQGGVTHVVVEQVWEPAAALRTPAPRSRDFH